MFDSIDQGHRKSKNKLLICLCNCGKMQFCQNISEELFVAVNSELELLKQSVIMICYHTQHKACIIWEEYVFEFSVIRFMLFITVLFITY